MRKKDSLPKKLPAEFKKYFWDVDFKKLSFQKHLKLILCRLLGFGNMKVIRWLFTNVSDSNVKNYLGTVGGRQLDKRSYTFWSSVYNVG